MHLFDVALALGAKMVIPIGLPNVKRRDTVDTGRAIDFRCAVLLMRVCVRAPVKIKLLIDSVYQKVSTQTPTAQRCPHTCSVSTHSTIHIQLLRR